MTNDVYQEENSIFSSDDRTYDLNYFWRETHNDPILHINVSLIKWVLDYSKDNTASDEIRIEKADLTAPLLVTNYHGRELIVDGIHRLKKAIRLGVKTLPYKRISKKLFDTGIIGKLTHTSTPEELLKWMDTHLTYKGENKGYLRTPKQVVEDSTGHCWETTELENNELTSMGYLCQTLYMTNNNLYNERTVTHSTLVYKDKNNKYYWFEWAWYKQQGIHGPYTKLEDMLALIKNAFVKQHKTIYAAKLSAVGAIDLTTETNYIDATDTWKDVLYSTSLENLSLVTNIELNRMYTEW